MHTPCTERRRYLASPLGLLALLALALSGCRDGLVGPGRVAMPADRVAMSAQSQAARPASETVPDQYVVVFNDRVQDVPGLSKQLIAEAEGRELFTYTHALRGFAAQMTAAKADALRRNSNVTSVTQDALLYTTGATWGLDRIDQRSLPLSGTYSASRSGSGVTAYIIDTGILFGHTEFGGRASLGYDFVGGDGTDCNGHGTHVAGTIGGATYGVAKQVKLVTVRVFGCSGGAATSTVIAAIDWVTGHAVRPAVVNMSLGGAFNAPTNDAVTKSIAAGIVYVLAAGNSGSDACDYSPASTPAAITVGATTSTDSRSSFSNWGPCVDVFAPGSAITSSWYTSNTAINTISGTSMASPHVAAVAALVLSENPSYTPARVDSVIKARATKGVVLNAASDNWNLVYSGLEADSRNVGSPPPVTTPIAPSGAIIQWGSAGTANGRTYADVAFKWVDNSGDETGFEVSGVSTSGATTSITGISANATVVAVRLPAGMTWSLKVRAAGAGVVSDWSEPASICLRSDGTVCDSAEPLLPPPPSDGAPVASFSANCAANKNYCRFDASTSTSSSGIASYLWAFGDGSSESTTSSASATHTYGSKGKYTVTLTVRDATGRSSTTSKTVTVKSVLR
jgi:subtilisin family serine protease